AFVFYSIIVASQSVHLQIEKGLLHHPCLHRFISNIPFIIVIRKSQFSMVQFPNCKINIGLNITRKREDGYHDLETIFYPTGLKDALEIIQSAATSIQLTGLPVPGYSGDNLCVKALNLLKKDFPQLPPVSIHLHKVIPMGAGLGGGSADAAFMLRMLDKKFQLHLTNEQLLKYALLLGSDCPFFITNKPCFATGRGEKMLPIQLDLSAYKIVLVYPGIHVSTSEAFSKLKPVVPGKNLQQLIQQPIGNWKDEIVNNFEEPVFQLYPEIKKVKDDLYNAGAQYSSMTGTGSAVFGIFDNNATTDLSFPKDYTWITLTQQN
ncbi:MAG TPA: 4-(cytidine 5'-diphospho)-2-C-methyl-D-erythritol kinase, partial [Segetibacter sp.]